MVTGIVKREWRKRQGQWESKRAGCTWPLHEEKVCHKCGIQFRVTHRNQTRCVTCRHRSYYTPVDPAVNKRRRQPDDVLDAECRELRDAVRMSTLTQTEIARRCGYSRQRLSQFMVGQTRFTEGNRERIRKVIDAAPKKTPVYDGVVYDPKASRFEGYRDYAIDWDKMSSQDLWEVLKRVPTTMLTRDESDANDADPTGLRGVLDQTREKARHCGMSYRELARRTGLSRQTIFAFVHGKNDPRCDTLAALWPVLGIYFGGIEIEEPSATFDDRLGAVMAHAQTGVNILDLKSDP